MWSMQIAVAQPDKPFQEPGEVCRSCQDFWVSQGMEPKIMEQLMRGGEMVTTERGTPIVVCGHCDGDVILRLNG